ncbi:MAG TPA: dihydroneopterin aldolase [Bacillota bacterium]|jgi:dihydroneopterin aldolase|nr:dihydroneopterin aldolase [Bacillota bacterium]HOB86397.1 dihydroneopterin aldolase [Bacillota bacterium]HOP68595.1 dihydroneopterin aldolase [Bacillota bacterium]HPT33324.1 dihydroneopterin aldolase [Bacillota bacterium]HPZ64002.1 dihydroneopterin aldolase [Bacillota bacterium]
MSLSILIEDITCYAFHGVLPQEQELGQEFRVTVRLRLEECDLESDSLEGTVDYCDVVLAVQEIMHQESCRLLETLAGRLADRLLSLPKVAEVDIRLSKPHPPLPGVRGGVAVELNRKKERR